MIMCITPCMKGWNTSWLKLWTGWMKGWKAWRKPNPAKNTKLRLSCVFKCRFPLFVFSAVMIIIWWDAKCIISSEAGYWQGDHPDTADLDICVLCPVYDPTSGYKGHCVIRSGFVSPTFSCFCKHWSIHIVQWSTKDCICWRYILISQSLPGKLTNWGRASEVWGWATSTASTRGTAPSLGTLGQTLTSPSNGQQSDTCLLNLCSFERRKSISWTQNHLQRDVNVPHGKAATETLMLTTVVSLASDDPGPELGTRRGEEERRERELRCYGPGVTPGEERGVRSDGRGGARPGQCQCQD